MIEEIDNLFTTINNIENMGNHCKNEGIDNKSEDIIIT